MSTCSFKIVILAAKNVETMFKYSKLPQLKMLYLMSYKLALNFIVTFIK